MHPSKILKALCLSSVLFATGHLTAADDEDKGHPLAGMPLRSIGPALTSGRVSDFAFQPGAPQVFYAAMASGGLWKTDNEGITWKPIFDDQGAYALGVVASSMVDGQVFMLRTDDTIIQPLFLVSRGKPTRAMAQVIEAVRGIATAAKPES